MDFYSNELKPRNFKYYEEHCIDYSQFDKLPRLTDIGNPRLARIIYHDEVKKHLSKMIGNLKYNTYIYIKLNNYSDGYYKN